MTRRFYFTIDVDYIHGAESGLTSLYEFCERHDLRATLFVSGLFAITFSNLIRDGAQRGFTLGAHGWGHPTLPEDFGTAPRQRQYEWIKQTTEAIERASGVRPRCFRAPDLSISTDTLSILEELAYRIDSSVPARRFDMWRGHSNSLRHFHAPLTPYHPSRRNLARKGNSPVLEIAPSAAVVPLNMAALRVLGLRTLRLSTRLVAAQSESLVFYCHPSEVTDPTKITILPNEGQNFLCGLGPGNLELLAEYVHFVRRLGYQPSDFNELLLDQPPLNGAGEM